MSINLLSTWAPIRTLGDQHRERVARHLLELDDADRTLRFGHLASDERVRQYAAQIDFQGDEVFGVFDRRLHLVGMAHLAFAAGRDTAEFGVSVHPRQRGRGLGMRLFEHAVIHAEVPRPVNVSYLVDGAVLHPGDSFTVPDADVEVLLLPAAAPWLRIADVVDQMRAIAATHTRPIHDGILSEDGKGVVDGVLSGLAEGVTDYRRLAPGEPWTF